MADPDVGNDLPHGSFINVHDFASMRDLANHMRAIFDDPKVYASFFQWREQPNATMQLFSRLAKNNFYARGRHSWFCGVCEVYEREFDPTGQRCAAESHMKRMMG